MPNIFPKPLKKGDRIAIISPAGAVDKSQVENGIQLIESNGYEPVLGKYVFGKYSNGYLYSGTEEERTSDMNWALNDENIAAIWATRGGYGCQHLLENLELTGFTKKPRWYIGYSDNTVIQSFLLKNKFCSIHGQTLKTSSFGVIDDGYNLIFDILNSKLPSYKIDAHKLNKKGTVKGELIGGNLALIYALLGSPYSFNFKNKILFIEDIGEKFYAVDRMLISLDHAGVFRQIKGLIIGGMTLMEEEKENKNYEQSFDEFSYQIIAERIAKYNFPVLFGFPNGHIYDNRPLIIGSKIKLEVGEANKLTFE